MTYPVDESFENSPPSGYYTVGGSSPVVIHNPIDQCLDMSGGTAMAWVRFNQPASGDMWFECDVKMTEDNVPWDNHPYGAPNYKHFGVQLTSSSGSMTEGIRFGFYQDELFIGYYNTGNAKTDIQYGTRYRTAELDRLYTLGMRIRENPNIGSSRHVQVFLDGVLQYQLYGAPNWYPESQTWRPEVWRYNCNIKIYAFRGNLGSGLTGWPETVGMRGPTLRPLRIPHSDRWDEAWLMEEVFAPNCLTNIGAGNTANTRVGNLIQPRFITIRGVLEASKSNGIVTGKQR